VARFDARPELARAALRPVAGSPDLEAGDLPSPGSFRWRQGRARGAFELAETGAFRVVVLLKGELALTSAAEPSIRANPRPGQAVLIPAAAGALRGEGQARFLWVDPA
jgi:hypothetical protein